MVRVFRWDGKEIFINPDNILFLEEKEKYSEVIMTDGKAYSLSTPSFQILSGMVPKRGPGKAGFDVI
jgi:DNA-binding LytR/AlgR family response regulator